MELSNVIAIGSIATTVILTITGWSIVKNTSASKDNQEKNDILITLNSDMKYNTKQLENIDKKLQSIENKLDDTALKVARHDSDIKTLFENRKLDLYRIRRIESHVGIKGDEEDE